MKTDYRSKVVMLDHAVTDENGADVAVLNEVIASIEWAHAGVLVPTTDGRTQVVVWESANSVPADD